MRNNENVSVMGASERHATTKKGFIVRAVMLLLALAILGAALTGCSSAPAHQISAGNVTVTDANNLDIESIKSLANQIVNVQGKTFDADGRKVTAQEGLVAALRGYDMTADGFDDDDLPAPNTDASAEYAINVLNAVNENISKEKDKIEYVIYKDMNAADLESLVDCIKTEVDISKPNFIGTILHWIGIAFQWMINVLGFGSFILGSLFFAILVEIIMLPISINQQKNSRKQARLRPKEMAIRKKYAGRNDQVTMQKLNTEIQELYQREGYNPMSAGCLPLLLSLPIIMALYYIVIDPAQYILGCSSGASNALTTFAKTSQAAGGLGMSLQSDRGTIEILSLIGDKLDGISAISNFEFFSNAEALSKHLADALAGGIPNFTLGGINFGLIPSFDTPSLLWAIPVFTFVVYFFSMKLNRKLSYQPTTADDKAAGCSNKMMDIIMPLMSVWITFIVPAAVGVYWIFKSLVGTVKQFIMSKVMPMPQFTEEDYKAAERELLGKEKKKPKKPSGTKNPNVRSLHHIDDEDFATEKSNSNTKNGTAQKIEAPAESEPAVEVGEENKTDTEPASAHMLINGAPLKDDDRDTSRLRIGKRKKKDNDD